ncbi:zinc-binding protein A33-like, partial [Chiloscyllium plagiosum]|uniref:zinc-binding protein A33-like n=1 Tax=Chiloscyllium plagiosum TaxID=36176 RepID=UPI001CB7F041
PPFRNFCSRLQDQLKSSLDLAAKRKAQLLKAKFNQEQKISQVKEQSRNLQVHIKYELAKMHWTLSEMERRLDGDLRAREGMILEAMRGNLREIQGALDSAERVLTEFQSRLDRPDVLTILKEKDSWNAKISHNAMELVDMDLPLGIYRGPLQYIAWREMLDTISP